MIISNISVHHHALHKHIQEPSVEYVIWMPLRIQQKWFKDRGKRFPKFRMTKALQRSKISTQDFAAYWKVVKDNIPDKELYSLFVKAFGMPDNDAGKMDFITDILRRYKVMSEAVCAHNHNYLMNISIARHMLHKHIQEPSFKCDIWLPRRIGQKWSKAYGTTKEFGLTRALKRSNITAQEFKKCWALVRDHIPDKELYSLFVKAFGVRHNIAGRVYFVEDILRRHKAMDEPVCLSGMSVFRLSDV